MQSRLGLAHFFVFVTCGLISVMACCLGVFGVITHNSLATADQVIVMQSSKEQDIRSLITHPKDKAWEPVFVLSQNITGFNDSAQ